MNTQTTIEKMNQLRLKGMSQAYYRSLNEVHFPEHTADELIGLLVDTEWEERYNRKIKNLVKAAGFKEQASPANIDYTARRNLDKNVFERLLHLKFIKKAENIIITGPTGVGKSYLAQAIGLQACHQAIKTLYYSWMDLVELIKLAKLDGTYIRLLKKIQKADLVIIDDFGLHPFDRHARQALMDIVEDRYNRTSMIFSAQVPVSEWHQIIGEGTVADAILDRLVYASHRIELDGQSLRKNRTLQG